MTKKDKELLLQTLCARLPYGVVIQTVGVGGSATQGKLQCIENAFNNFFIYHDDIGLGYEIGHDDIKPYLFPMSSMTEEDIYQINDILGEDFEVDEQGITDLIRNRRTSLSYLELDALFSYLNKNHFDYRGLIEKGLAIDATNLNIY